MTDSTLHFEIGGYPNISDCVTLKDGQVHCYMGVGLGMFGSPRIVTPSEQDWRLFWQSMDQIGVWKWRDRYDNFEVLDGTAWGLKLAYQGRHLECEGTNMYPPDQRISWSDDSEFGRFMTALQKLASWDGLGGCEQSVCQLDD